MITAFLFLVIFTGHLCNYVKRGLASTARTLTCRISTAPIPPYRYGDARCRSTNHHSPSRYQFEERDSLSEYISLDGDDCVVKLDINGGRAFGNRMRELKSERGIEFNDRYNDEGREFRFGRQYFMQSTPCC